MGKGGCDIWEKWVGGRKKQGPVLLALCARGAAAEDELRLRLALERVERVCMPPGLERLSAQPPENKVKKKWALEKWRRENGEGDIGIGESMHKNMFFKKIEKKNEMNKTEGNKLGVCVKTLASSRFETREKKGTTRGAWRMGKEWGS